MKESEKLVQLGDRVQQGIIDQFDCISQETGIARQQLTQDAMALYLRQGDESVRERQRYVLLALRKCGHAFPMGIGTSLILEGAHG